ncbi:MAG: protein-S-isoprenylcysteine methyltransferase [Sphingomonas bacterium]|nr:protein-S-isoprenylcysteine methyltransferase [Sphingomonas bacterium]
MHQPATIDPRPASAVSAGVGFAGLVGLFAWAGVAWTYHLDGPFAALSAILAGGVPMVLWSLLVDRVHRNPSTGIDWSGPPRPWREALDTGLVKLAGLWATWGLIACLYCLARWYWQGNYLFAMHCLQAFLPLLLIASIPYVLLLERRLVNPHDGLWTFGNWLMGGGAGPEARAKLADHARAWTIKGFFTAFMLAGVPGNWQNVIDIDVRGLLGNPVALAADLIAVMFMIDMCLATVGYLLTMRPLDSHIRSANPFASGWTAALICYPPFVLMNTGGPLDYHHGELGWARAMSDHPMLQPVFAAALIVLTGIYAWATMAFGLRFSNLTHRGIITNGPYRWSKHPAYLSKNLFWWIAGLPMLTTTGLWTDAVRNTLIMAIVSGVYYWRARTEEAHLSADPAYVAYAGWMARNVTITRAFARIGRRRRAEPVGVPAE